MSILVENTQDIREREKEKSYYPVSSLFPTFFVFSCFFCRDYWITFLLFFALVSDAQMSPSSQTQDWISFKKLNTTNGMIWVIPDKNKLNDYFVCCVKYMRIMKCSNVSSVSGPKSVKLKTLEQYWRYQKEHQDIMY